MDKIQCLGENVQVDNEIKQTEKITMNYQIVLE